MPELLRYEEAENAKKKAEREQSRIQDDIQKCQKDLDAYSQAKSEVNMLINRSKIEKYYLEKALENCDQMIQKQLLEMKEAIQTASTLYSNALISDFDNINLFGVYDDEITQTDNVLKDIQHELADKLAEIKRLIEEKEAEFTDLKKKIGEYEDNIAGLKKESSLCEQCIQQSDELMKKYQ